MDIAEVKRQWKRFNCAVNDLGRCVACNRYFEHEAYLCSEAHNRCLDCYDLDLVGTTCSYLGCKGVWMEPNCKNIVITDLSRLRHSLYASRAEMSKWKELPWLDLLQCVVCYEVMDSEIFMCQHGHNWCGRCQQHLSMHRKCPYCNVAFTIVDMRNKTLEEMVKQMKIGQAARSVPFRRKGKFECPIESCWEQFTMQAIYCHLRDEHPDRYFQLEERECDENKFYKITTISPHDFSGAIKIHRIGLFGLLISFKFDQKGWKYFGDVYVYCFSATRPAFNYLIRLVYHTKKRKTAETFRSGVTLVTDTQEVAKSQQDGIVVDLGDKVFGIPIAMDSKIDVYLRLTPSDGISSPSNIWELIKLSLVS